MIIVADTSPINYLVLIKEIEVLPKLYGKIVIPETVREELLRPEAPEIVRIWTAQAPAWIETRTPASIADSFARKARRRRTRRYHAGSGTQRGAIDRG
jgi:predicted nucleic acid-binding protein